MIKMTQNDTRDQNTKKGYIGVQMPAFKMEDQHVYFFKK